MASLTVRNLSKSFGAVEVLKGIDLEVETGEFIVLVGPSGCGKSTLLAMIAGLETITSGEIAIGGRVVNSVPPKDRDIAMVFQSYALYPTMTVRQNITFGMESRGVPKAEQAKAVARVSALLQIEQLLDTQAGAALRRPAPARRHGPGARARPAALPLRRAALQPRRQAARRDAHRDQEALPALGKTTVYVTHDQVEAMTLASRIAVMHQGRLQQFAAPRDVYERPANIFVAGFMGSPAMNFLPAEIVAGEAGPALALTDGNGASTVLDFRHGAGARAGRDGASSSASGRRTSPATIPDAAAAGERGASRSAGGGGRADGSRDHGGAAHRRARGGRALRGGRGAARSASAWRSPSTWLRPACSTPRPSG